MKTRHTAGEWTVGGYTGRIGADTQGDIIITAPDRCAVATVCYHGDSGEKEANAELICRAVNNHDALVEALRGIFAQTAKHSREWGQAASAAAFARDPDTAKAFAAARAALEKAGAV